MCTFLIFQSKTSIEDNGISTPSNISLTALCVIALYKSVQNDQEAGDGVKAMKSTSPDYIAAHIDNINDPFEMAIATYALVISNNNAKENALGRLRSMNKTGKQCAIVFCRYVFKNEF